jgi:predicted metal-dependent phosphoesterase TrpH
MIDLHSHSSASDGADSPSSLVIKASKLGLVALAITDHDTLFGLDEAEEQAKLSNLLVIRGVELEVNFPTGDFHLLGLNLGKNVLALEQKLKQQQQKREERNKLIIEKINSHLNLTSSYSAVQSLAKGVVGRLHFAKYLVEQKKCRTIQEAFDRYLRRGAPCYAPKEAMELDEALALIKQAGGKSVLAHPLSLFIALSKLPETLKKLHQQGLQGIEAYHSYCTLGQGKRLEQMANVLNLEVTAGSDYHGENRQDRKLGYSCKGKVAIDNRFAQWLLSEQQQQLINHSQRPL